MILFVYCYTNNFHVWIHTFSFLQRSRVALKKVSSISKIRTYKDFEIISDETFSHIRWKNNNRIDQLFHNHQLNTKNTRISAYNSTRATIDRFLIRGIVSAIRDEISLVSVTLINSRVRIVLKCVSMEAVKTREGRFSLASVRLVDKLSIVSVQVCNDWNLRASREIYTSEIPLGRTGWPVETQKRGVVVMEHWGWRKGQSGSGIRQRIPEMDSAISH